MARAIWTGTLSFGLVSIPVEVHTAVRDHRPRFRLLHARDRSRVSFERVCQKEGRKVAWNDLVKGYEYSKNRFVVVTKDDEPLIGEVDAEALRIEIEADIPDQHDDRSAESQRTVP